MQQWMCVGAESDSLKDNAQIFVSYAIEFGIAHKIISCNASIEIIFYRHT